MRNSPIKLPVRILGRMAPSALRFLAHRNPLKEGRWSMVSALRDDKICRDWLAQLENPTKTRRGFKIFTLAGDVTSDWIKLHGEHETATEKFILEQLKPNSTFLDIGANIGYFTLLAAVTGKAKVISYEPQRPIAELLLKSIVHNQIQDVVKVEQVALSNAPATMKMMSSPGNSGRSSLVDFNDENAQSYPVPVVVFDDWLRENPSGPVSVCKIDTEGAELQVLQGMLQLLDREGPAIVIEIIDAYLARFGASKEKILMLLKEHGYTDVSADYTFQGDPNYYFVRQK